MLTSWKRLSQPIAITALSLAMFAAMGTARSSAANIKTINIAGTFGINLIPREYREGFYDPKLEYGTFVGYYTLDLDQLPTEPYDSDPRVTNWNVILQNSSGATVTNFSRRDEGFILASSKEVILANGIGYESLSLFVNSDLTLRQELRFGVPTYGYYELYADKYTPIGRFNVTSNSVPEPFTLGGTAVAGVMGFWLRRRKLKASLPESHPNNI
ncbi:PEP-CTERM sorting domain-containing protein [Cylindrospermum sp. FACHB-282]|uniref:PEP-CTERM sorting domain-containing protein n=1 Tax=Cylindrospermum sp. FACHB-282 TaxID=2692794 RepID=UPI001681EDFF|nr:PEP-CTERM sorting domain-containing protein [Cylindrospermum sp. FACHB-282]MBD2388225.1 PEP-CTERM sorting domain-containing protein [Cylindrospermum sp. FACHB-282]